MTAAQAIRSAALSWPMGFLSDEENQIYLAYTTEKDNLLSCSFGSIHDRTFMLMVAEELDGGIGQRMRDGFDRMGQS